VKTVLNYQKLLPLGMIVLGFLVLLFGCAVTKHTRHDEKKRVTGTVTDSAGHTPLPGVDILLKGAHRGTSTDSLGHYSLSVSSLKDTLRFAYIGYKTKKVPIMGRRTINITLALNPKMKNIRVCCWN
jgi:hypothetical protein